MKNKRKGSLAISIVIILALTPFLTATMINIIHLESSVKKDSERILEEYNYEAYYNVALIDALEKLYSTSITYPITVLDDTVFAYEKAIDYIPSQNYTGNFKAKFSTIGNNDILNLIDEDMIIDIQFSDFLCNYSNAKNVLIFETSDKLYLEPVEVTIKLDNSTYLYNFIISDLYLYITHQENDFTLNVFYDEIAIERN